MIPQNDKLTKIDLQPKFKHGDTVEKVGGDYFFVGEVVSVFKKKSLLIRYVVEDDRGCLHIYSEKNLRHKL